MTARQCLEHPWLSFKTPFLIETIGSTILSGCIDSDVFSKDTSEEREETQVDSSSSCSASPSPSPSPVSSLPHSRYYLLCSFRGDVGIYQVLFFNLSFFTSSSFGRSQSSSTPTSKNVVCTRRSSHPLVNACPVPAGTATVGVSSPVPSRHQLTTILTSSPVEITVDRGIIC